MSNSDAIYQRTSFAWWNGGRIVDERRMGDAVNLTLVNVTVEDPLPSLNPIQLDVRPPATSAAAQQNEEERWRAAAAAEPGLRYARKAGPPRPPSAWMFASVGECRRVTGLGGADCGAEPEHRGRGRGPGAGAGAAGMAVLNMVLKNVRIANVSTVRECPAHFAQVMGCNCVPACEVAGPLPMGIPSIITGGPDASHNVTGLHFVNVTVAGMGMRQALASGAAHGPFDVAAWHSRAGS